MYKIQLKALLVFFLTLQKVEGNFSGIKDYFIYYAICIVKPTFCQNSNQYRLSNFLAGSELHYDLVHEIFLVANLKEKNMWIGDGYWSFRLKLGPFRVDCNRNIINICFFFKHFHQYF